MLDRGKLFRERWGYRSIGQRQRLDLESRLLAMWHQLTSPEHWSAAVVWAAFAARRHREVLALEASRWPITLGILADRRPGWLASFWDRPGTVVLQAVTLGDRATRLAKKSRGAVDRLHWHGLAAEAAEALAQWCSQRASQEMGWRDFRRISPGFPVWPDLSEQRKIFRLLKPKRIGIRLKRSLCLEPEYSTTAALFPA